MSSSNPTPQEMITMLAQAQTGAVFEYMWALMSPDLRKQIMDLVGINANADPTQVVNQLTTYVQAHPELSPTTSDSGTPTPPAYPGGAGQTQIPLSQYINAINSAGLPLNSSTQALAQQAFENQWNMARFANELRQTPEYEQDTAASFENMVYNAGLYLTPEIQGLISKAVKLNWSSSEFSNALRDTQVFQQESAVNFQAQVFNMGLTMNPKMNELIQTAISQNWSMTQFQMAVRQTDQFYERNSVGFKSLLQSYGFDVSGGNLDKLLHQAVAKQYNSTEFLYFLRKTPEYHKEFPGIFDNEGHLKMSEDQYIAQKQSYAQIAATTGLNWSDARSAYLFRNDTSPAEFQMKAQALVRLRDNNQLLNQFSTEYARQTGKTPTRGDLFHWIMGEGDKSFTEVWNMAIARNAAIEGGIHISQGAGYADLSRKTIKSVADKGLSEAAMGQIFQQIGDQLLTTLPASRINKLGLNKELIKQAVAGGPKAAEARQLIARVTATESAFWGNRAAPQLEPTATGSVLLGQQSQARAQTQ